MKLAKILKKRLQAKDQKAVLPNLATPPAAIEAWANALVFEHPELFKWLTDTSASGRTYRNGLVWFQ